MQVYTWVLHVWHAWKRSITGWFTQQYQLYAWSVLAGARDVYSKLVQYPGMWLLAVAGGAFAFALPDHMAGIAMCICGISVIGVRITTINVDWYVRLYDMYLALYTLPTAWKSEDRSYRELRGHALDVFVVVMMVQVGMWLIWYYGVVPYMFASEAMLIPWRYLLYANPAIMFICFFVVDSGYTIWGILYSVRRALRLIWFYLPLCLIITSAAFAWMYGLSFVPYGWILDIGVIPVWVSIWYTVYTKAIYEQFARYYEDIFTCRADTA